MLSILFCQGAGRWINIDRYQGSFATDVDVVIEEKRGAAVTCIVVFFSIGTGFDNDWMLLVVEMIKDLFKSCLTCTQFGFDGIKVAIPGAYHG